MVDPIVLLAFLPASLALNLTPGADMMFCIAQGARAGSRAAWASRAGVATGGLIHALLAGVGLSALVAALPIALDVIRWCGVAYLVWLAWRALRDPSMPSKPTGTQVRRAFLSGLTVNLTNPKVILFVLAFLPQFVSPEVGPVLPQFAVLGALLAFGGLIVNGVAGQFAARSGAGFLAVSRIMNYVSAGVFLALALRLAIWERA